jgi:hypothetical protein
VGVVSHHARDRSLHKVEYMTPAHTSAGMCAACVYMLWRDELNSMARATVFQKCLMETHRLMEISQIVYSAMAIPKYEAGAFLKMFPLGRKFAYTIVFRDMVRF